MYRKSYAEALGDQGAEQRIREREAIEHSIQLLQSASVAGPNSRESVEAVTFANRLWTYLLEDLSSDLNALPVEVRAGLISIGIWILREIEAIRQGQSHNFQGVADVSRLVAEGLA